MNERELRAALSTILVRADGQRMASATFTARELDAWPTDLRDALIQSRILRRSRPQQAVPCPQCDEDHVVEVEWIDERALAWCPTTGRIAIDARLLDSFTFIPGRLAEHLHELLGIGEPLQAITPDRLWRLGVLGDTKPPTVFFLVRGVGWDDAIGLLEHPSIRRAPDAVVVTFMDAPGIGANRMLPLARVLTITRGRLAVDVPVALAALAESEPATSPPILRREGDGWHISYEGERVALGDVIGLAYIRQLVRSPFHDFEPEELASLAGVTAGRSRSVLLANDGLEPVAHQATPILDAKGRRDLTARIVELREAGHVEKAAELQSHLTRATRPGGAPKVFETPSVKAARNVRRAIRRALDTVQQQAPRCSLHLRGAIVLSAGEPLSYRPDRATRWDTD